MGGSMDVFVNEKKTSLTLGASVRQAVQAFDGSLLEALDAGRGYVTDGVGRRVDTESVLGPGSILRVVTGAAQSDETEE